MKALIGVLLVAAAWAGEPKFADYPAGPLFTGTPAPPVLNHPQFRMYRTRIREGVATGRGVWTGVWRGEAESKGPNFAGHYSVIRWGCGSDCLMMAVVDLKTGSVHMPPITSAPGQIGVPMDVMSKREIDFRPDSTLMVLRNVCPTGQRDCGVYAFRWTGSRFALVQRTLIDITKEAR